MQTELCSLTKTQTSPKLEKGKRVGYRITWQEPQTRDNTELLFHTSCNCQVLYKGK